jgi:cytoskeletal protein RodZ
MTPKPIYSQLATLIQRRRKSKQLSRIKVAKQLKLPLSTIIDLENPSKSRIPTSHLPGLYRRYAQVVGLDTNDFDNLLKKIENKSLNPENRKRKSSRTLIISSTIRRTIVSLVLVSLSVYALWQFGILFAAPKLITTNIDEYSIVTQSKFEIQGESDKNSAVFINGEPITVDEAGEFSHILYLQPGYNSFELSTSNNFGRETKLRRVVFLESN